MFTHFVANSEKISQIRVSRGPTKIIAILHRGVIEIYYNTTKGGGPSRFITILQGEGGFLREQIGASPVGEPNHFYTFSLSQLCCSNLLLCVQTI